GLFRDNSSDRETPPSIPTATRKQTVIVMNQKQSFLYVTVISTTPEKLWETLTNPDFIVRYWFGRRNESTWKVGAPIESRSPKGELEWRGHVIENDPPRLLSFTFDHVNDNEPPSRVTFAIEQLGTEINPQGSA